MSETKFSHDEWTVQHDADGDFAIYSGMVLIAITDGDSSADKANAYLMAAAPKMYAALQGIKDWFMRLEDGMEPNDPLSALRKKYHAPVHTLLDNAIRKAKANS